MKFGKSIIASGLLMASITLTGCFGSNAKQSGIDPKHLEGHSEALQVMIVSGNAKFLRDVELGEEHDVTEGAISNALQAGVGLGFLNGTMTSMPGISDGAMGATFLISALVDEAGLEKGSNWIEAWMPSSMAKNEEEARVIWTQMLSDSAVAALPEGYSAELYELLETPKFVKACTKHVFRVTGPACPNGSCAIVGDLKHDSERRLCGADEMKLGPTPVFVKTGDSMSYYPAGMDKFGLYKLKASGLEKFNSGKSVSRRDYELIEGFDYAAYLSAVSSHLPNWVYWYFGPENKENPTQIPIVMNQGKALMFIKPSPVN